MAAVAAMATATVLDSGSDVEDYSFALEYDGPLPSYVIPHAVPIDIDQIPIATTASLVPGSAADGGGDDSMLAALPVVQPLLSPPPPVSHRCHHKEDDDKDRDHAAVVSPTSVIAFDRGGSEAVSGEIASSCGAASGGGDHGSPSCHGGDGESGELLCSSSEAAVAFSGEFKEEGEEGEDEEVGDDADGNEEEDHQQDQDHGIADFEGEYEEEAEASAASRSRALTESAASSEFGFGSSAASGDLLDPSSSTATGAATGASTSRNTKRGPAVKFHDGDWVGSGSASASGSTSPSIHSGKPHTAKGEPSTSGSRPRKGACHRCGKGNRFTDKESCIVCGARYCAGCLLRAMGSMPEGRKCVPCIGFSVDEDRRERLGKSSRMLRKLLTSEEIQHIMKEERSCEVNQISASHVVVNGRPLTRDEMIVLKNCPNPPSKLKPGNYWYDKVSGYWGEECHKPCKIITANLSIGGSLIENASNGNTGVFINSREITKAELRMLQLAGVQCAGCPHFWVNSDGTYQEEGMKTIKGNLWDKARMRFICSLLSLPLPPKVISSSREDKEVISGSAPNYFDPRSLQKLLLVGCHGSGTGTIFKQAKIMYTPNSFSEKERDDIKVKIQSSIYHYLGVLLEGRERFEEECLAEKRSIVVEEDAESVSTGSTSNGHAETTAYSISPRLKAFSDWFLKFMASGDEAIFLAATREYAPVVEELWKDPAIQATYCRRNELPALSSVANYFLDRVVDISRSDYEPSNSDILNATGITSRNGLAYTEFFFPHTNYDCSGIDDASEHEIAFRYQLIKVPTKGLTESCKWLEMFEDARMVIFCAALTDYDEYFEDQNGVVTNKMLASKKLFESIATHPTFEQMNFLMILSKFDLLEAKIEQSPLTKCDWFSDFNPVRSSHRHKSSTSGRDNHNTTPAQQAFHYVAVKFKNLFASLTGRKLYVVQANCLKSESVDIALRYAKEIQKWEDEIGWVDDEGDYSLYSAEPSSLSN